MHKLVAKWCIEQGYPIEMAERISAEMGYATTLMRKFMDKNSRLFVGYLRLTDKEREAIENAYNKVD